MQVLAASAAAAPNSDPGKFEVGLAMGKLLVSQLPSEPAGPPQADYLMRTLTVLKEIQADAATKVAFFTQLTGDGDGGAGKFNYGPMELDGADGIKLQRQDQS